MMRNVPLRTQLAVVLIGVQLYSLGVAASYWVQARTYARLDHSFRHELDALSALPRLNERVRHLDQLAGQYAVSGDPGALRERAAVVDDVRKTSDALSTLLAGDEESGLFRRLDQELAAYLSEQERWIAARRSGRLSTAAAARWTRRRGGIHKLVETLIAIENANVAKLEGRRGQAEAAARFNLWLIFATGIAVALAIALFLSRYLVGPLRAIQAYASSWKLGDEWRLKRAPASPELVDLQNTLSRLTAQLNRQYEREKELGRFKTQLVSMVSHEFNNALSVIGGIVSLLESSEPPRADAKRAQYYQVMQSHVLNLGAASATLLNMGRMETGRFAVEPREVDLAPTLRAVLQRLEILGERKRLTLNLELPNAPLRVKADPEVLSLVATNLLTNAIKYTPEGGTVAVGIAPEPGDLARTRVFVRDTGIGISREDQERIFSAFYRAETGKKAAKGFGVGLSLAHAAVEAHGGSLRVESEPGKGATFYFTLERA